MTAPRNTPTAAPHTDPPARRPAFHDSVPVAEIPAVKDPVHGAILDARLWQCARALWEAGAARAQLPPAHRDPDQFQEAAVRVSLLTHDALTAWDVCGLDPGPADDVHPAQLLAAQRVNIVSARAMVDAELYPELTRARRTFQALGFIDPTWEVHATADLTPEQREARSQEPLLVRFIGEIQDPAWPDCEAITGAVRRVEPEAGPCA